jgi:hypothetical protein
LSYNHKTPTDKAADSGAFIYLSAKVNLVSASVEKALPLSLFPSTGWWAACLRAPAPAPVFTGTLSNISGYNRYKIVTANGVQELSVPLKGGRKQRVPLAALQIDYTHDWQRQHWGALYSAYGRAPFYEHYAAQLKAIIYHGYEGLHDLNLASVHWLAKEMRLSLSFDEMAGGGAASKDFDLPPYHQVFEDRFGFLPNLSAIDLLMNEGPYSATLLK